MLLSPIQCVHTTKYIQFNLDHQTEKTHHWSVLSIKHNTLLGIIKWYGAWRQYAFFPEPNTVFNVECLGDIESFIEQEMERRRIRLKKQVIEVNL